MIKGVICDLDGFLVKTWEAEPLPGVVETLAVLKARGIQIAVASNQAGPLWRMATGDEKYPTAANVVARLATCALALDLTNKEVIWYVALSDEKALALMSEQIAQQALKKVFYGFIHETRKMALHIVASDGLDWRKPSPKMLWAACAKWGVSRSEAIYGGDLDSDRQAAEAAGMRFVQTLPEVLSLLD